MTITANVPMPTDWDDVPRGSLLQASFNRQQVLCLRMAGDRGEVLVLRSTEWETLPSVAPADAFDPCPLVLPGTFIVEAIPGSSGDYAAGHQVANGNLRVTSDGRAAVVVVGASGRGGHVVSLGSPESGSASGKHPVDFSRWRIIEVEPGQPRSAGRVVFEHGAPMAAEPALGGVGSWPPE